MQPFLASPSFELNDDLFQTIFCVEMDVRLIKFFTPKLNTLVGDCYNNNTFMCRCIDCKLYKQQNCRCKHFVLCGNRNLRYL